MHPPAISLHFHVFHFQKDDLLKETLSATQTQGEVPSFGQVQTEGVEEPKENVLPMLMYTFPPSMKDTFYLFYSDLQV